MGLVTKGDFNEYVSESPIQLGIFGSPTQTYTVSEIDTKGAEEITVQVTNGVLNSETGIISQGDSTNLTASFYSDVGMGYTSVPLGILNLGTNSSDMWFGITGHYKLKIIFNNADINFSTKVTYKVVVKK
jgi:hypothetical protein